MNSFRARVPGKVNFSLLVGPPAADGYHPLFTVFAPLDLHDELQFDLEVVTASQGDRATLSVDCPGIPSEMNLVTRALRAVEAATGRRFSGRVGVTKGVPVGAGLGGGSADGALALRVAAALVASAGGPQLGDARLRELARRLGADVAFFLDPRPALARGVGDILEPLPLPAVPLVMVLPDGGLSTAEVYRTFDGVAAGESAEAFEARCLRAEQAWRSLSAAWASGGMDQASACLRVAALLQNDLERASMHIMPALATHKAVLERRGVLGALMSGSGPTVFGVCSSREQAEGVAGELRAEGLPARLVWAGPPRSGREQGSP